MVFVSPSVNEIFESVCDGPSTNPEKFPELMCWYCARCRVVIVLQSMSDVIGKFEVNVLEPENTSPEAGENGLRRSVSVRK